MNHGVLSSPFQSTVFRGAYNYISRNIYVIEGSSTKSSDASDSFYPFDSIKNDSDGKLFWIIQIVLRC